MYLPTSSPLRLPALRPTLLVPPGHCVLTRPFLTLSLQSSFFFCHRALAAAHGGGLSDRLRARLPFFLGSLIWLPHQEVFRKGTLQGTLKNQTGVAGSSFPPLHLPKAPSLERELQDPGSPTLSP